MVPAFRVIMHNIYYGGGYMVPAFWVMKIANGDIIVILQIAYRGGYMVPAFRG